MSERMNEHKTKEYRSKHRRLTKQRSHKKVRTLPSPEDMAPFIEEKSRTVGDVTYDYSNVYGWNLK